MKQIPLSPIDKMALKTCTSCDYQRQALAYNSRYASTSNPTLSQEWRRRLHDILIPPEISSLLMPEKILTIVPHGPLYNLAFQALIDSSGSYLIEKTSISYAPSLSLLQELVCREEKQDLSNSGLIIGVSQFQGRHPALPNAIAEASEIAQNSTLPCELILDEQVTLANLKTFAGQYRFIHLATHGISNVDHGRLAGIALYDTDVRLDDLASLGIVAPLVTLSTCNSGQGIGQLGNQIGGLAGHFIAQSAKTVIASLWPIHDTTSRTILTRFYREIERFPPALALARTQRGLFDSEPFEWASLSCFGLS